MVTTDEDDEGYDEGKETRRRKGDKTKGGGVRRKMIVYKAIFPVCEKKVHGGVDSRVWRWENMCVTCLEVWKAVVWRCEM